MVRRAVVAGCFVWKVRCGAEATCQGYIVRSSTRRATSDHKHFQVTFLIQRRPKVVKGYDVVAVLVFEAGRDRTKTLLIGKEPDPVVVEGRSRGREQKIGLRWCGREKLAGSFFANFKFKCASFVERVRESVRNF